MAWFTRIFNVATSGSLRSIFSSKPEPSTPAVVDNMAQPSPSSSSQRFRHGTRPQSGNDPQSVQHPRRQIQRFSDYSSPAIPNSLYFAHDFMIGAGMAIIQPSTGKVVLVYDSRLKIWFLPKGRKDVGESLEQAVLREAYEESGYRVGFLPLWIPANAPYPPDSSNLSDLTTEPIYITTTSWSAELRLRRRAPNEQIRPGDLGGEYFVFWYVGQIPEDAVYESDTGMANEKHYTSHILDLQDACRKLRSTGGTKEETILSMAHELWQHTVKIQLEEAERTETDTNIDDVPPMTTQT